MLSKKAKWMSRARAWFLTIFRFAFDRKKNLTNWNKRNAKKLHSLSDEWNERNCKVEKIIINHEMRAFFVSFPSLSRSNEWSFFRRPKNWKWRMEPLTQQQQQPALEFQIKLLICDVCSLHWINHSMYCEIDWQSEPLSREQKPKKIKNFTKVNEKEVWNELQPHKTGEGTFQTNKNRTHSAFAEELPPSQSSWWAGGDDMFSLARWKSG